MPANATARDTSIRTYRAKRDFSVTREPAPARNKAKNGSLFVVQKHQARRAGQHWDFRLEHDGVLWSWAVRKGPSLDPSDKRIAVHVEDHPLDYADFQGSIPDGNTVPALWRPGTEAPGNRSLTPTKDFATEKSNSCSPVSAYTANSPWCG